MKQTITEKALGICNEISTKELGIIKKGDKVEITAGENKGKKGTIHQINEPLEKAGGMILIYIKSKNGHTYMADTKTIKLI